MAKFTEEELEMLSPEEREAIEGDTDAKSVEELRAEQEAEAAAKAKEEGAGAAQRNVDKKPEVKAEGENLEAIAAKAEREEREALEAGEKDRSEPEGASGDEAKADGASEAEKKEVPEKEAVAVPEKEGKTVVKEKPTTTLPPAEPAFVLEAEKKFGTVEEIEAKIVALDTKFEDGDITLAAYNKELSQYVATITEMKMFDKINAQVQKAALEKGWKDARHEFFSRYPEYSAERLKNVAFVDAVNRLIATEGSKSMSDAAVLEEARKECDAVFYPSGREPGAKDPAPAAPGNSAAEKKAALEAAKKKEAERIAGVKTLAKVPVSESNQEDSKFDAIDKLSGDAYEAAVAALSEADRKIYSIRQ